MKKLIIIIIGIIAATFFVSCASKSHLSSTSQVKKRNYESTPPQKNYEPPFRLKMWESSDSETEWNVGIITYIFYNPGENKVLIDLKKSSESGSVFHKFITLPLIQICYDNNYSDEYKCVLFQGEGITIYCSAEDSEEFPGKYLYIQCTTEKGTIKIVYDLTNLKLNDSEEYTEPHILSME